MGGRLGVGVGVGVAAGVGLDFPGHKISKQLVSINVLILCLAGLGGGLDAWVLPLSPCISLVSSLDLSPSPQVR